MDIDAALARVGGYRRWHFVMYLLVATSLHVPLCWQAMSIVFVGWQPPHTCIGTANYSLASASNYSYIESSETNSSKHDQNSPGTDQNCHVKVKVGIFDGGNESQSVDKTEECTRWSYENDGYYTIVEQWDLVCSHNFMSELSQTLYQVGTLVGEMFSFVVDIHGRKTLHILSHIIICILGVVTAYSVSYGMYAAFRSLVGLFVSINLTAGSMLVLELFDSQRRTLPGIMLQCFWAICYVILPGLVYLFRNWRHLQLAISLASVAFALILLLLPESPSWLYSKGQTKRAETILQKIAQWNKVKVDPNAIILTQTPQPMENGGEMTAKNSDASDTSAVKDLSIFVVDVEATKNASIANNANTKSGSSKITLKVLLTDVVLLKFLIISSLLWFSVCFAFYGLIYVTPNMGGNRFVNFILMGIVDLLATFLAYFASKRIGRRLASFITELIAGCFIIILIFIPDNTAYSVAMKIAFVIIAKGFISSTFSVMVLYTKEMFPTSMRATCCGICQAWGRIGSMIAPMMAYMLKTEYFRVPYFLFGAVSIFVSFTLLSLPETNGQPLPKDIEECYRLNDHNPFWKCRIRKRN